MLMTIIMMMTIMMTTIEMSYADFQCLQLYRIYIIREQEGRKTHPW